MSSADGNIPMYLWLDVKAWVKRRVGLCSFDGCTGSMSRIDPKTNLVPMPSLPPWDLNEYRWYRCDTCGLVDREQRMGATLRWALNK